jgi:uncharacterized protein
MTTPARDLLTVEEARALYAVGGGGALDAAHDFDHVLRVAALAEQIARAEGADVDIVRLAALLHDLPAAPGGDLPGAPGGDGRTSHHLAAAERARGLLAARGLQPERIEAVVHCIQAHRYRDRSVQPQTLEARCLYDADKLDAMGAIGVARACAFAGAHGSRLWVVGVDEAAALPAPQGRDYTPVHEYVFKLRRLLGTLHTPSARRIGEERHAFMVAFFERLDVEMREAGDTAL